MGDDTSAAFASFFELAEPRVRTALCGAFGADVGHDAAEEPTSYGALDQATALVDGFLGDYNDGDPLASVQPARPDRLKLIDGAYVVATDEWTGTGPCRFDDGDGTVCPIRRVDDFHGAAACPSRRTTAEGMPAALDLVDDFVAQSDRWS